MTSIFERYFTEREKERASVSDTKLATEPKYLKKIYLDLGEFQEGKTLLLEFFSRSGTFDMKPSRTKQCYFFNRGAKIKKQQLISKYTSHFPWNMGVRTLDAGGKSKTRGLHCVKVPLKA